MKLKLMILLLTGLFFGCNQKTGDELGKIKKINKVVFRSDIDKIISNMSPQEQKKYDNDYGKKKIFHEIMRYNIFDAEAKVEGLKKNKGFELEYESGIRHKIAIYDKRDIFKTLLFDEKKLLKFYNGNKSEFMGKDSTLLSFKDIKPLVVRKYLFANKDLKGLYKQNIKKYKNSSKINIRHIFSTSKNKLKLALEELNNGSKFSDVAKKYSEDLNSSNAGGVLGSYFEGQNFFGISDSLNSLYESIFSLKKGTYTKILKSEKGYHIFYLTSKREATVRSYKDVKADLVSIYIRKLQDSLKIEYPKVLKEKYVTFRTDTIKPDYSKIKSFYLSNSSKFLEKEVKILDISNKNYKVVTNIIKKMNKNISFEKLYEDSLNAKVISNKFYLPVDFKYPEFRREVNKLKRIGDVSPMFKTDFGYHIIKLIGLGKDSLPAYDSTRIDVESAYYNNYAEKHRNEKILKTGNLNLTFGNYIDIVKDKVSNKKEYINSFSKRSIDGFIEKEINAMIYYLDAKDRGLLKDKNLSYMIKYWNLSFWSYIYENEVIGKYDGYDKKTIDKIINNKSEFITTKDAVKKVIVKNLLTDSILKEFYNKNIGKFLDKNGVLVDFRVAKEGILQHNVYQILRNNKISYYRSLYKKYKVEFVVPEYIPTILRNKKNSGVQLKVSDADSLWKKAEIYLEKNNVPPAMKIYKKLSLTNKYREDASVKLARLLEGKKKFGAALTIYNDLLKTKLKNKDEVLFLKGFLYYNFLKRQDLSKKYFKQLLKEFPNSELADDASVLVKGNLPKFLK